MYRISHITKHNDLGEYISDYYVIQKKFLFQWKNAKIPRFYTTDNSTLFDSVVIHFGTLEKAEQVLLYLKGNNYYTYKGTTFKFWLQYEYGTRSFNPLQFKYIILLGKQYHKYDEYITLKFDTIKEATKYIDSKVITTTINYIR